MVSFQWLVNHRRTGHHRSSKSRKVKWLCSGHPFQQLRKRCLCQQNSIGYGCTPGKWQVAYDKWEYCHFQEGYCIITPEGQAPIHLRAGDIFIVEPGMKGTWEVVETVRKYFVFA